MPQTSTLIVKAPTFSKRFLFLIGFTHVRKGQGSQRAQGCRACGVEVGHFERLGISGFPYFGLGFKGMSEVQAASQACDEPGGVLLAIIEGVAALLMRPQPCRFN